MMSLTEIIGKIREIENSGSYIQIKLNGMTIREIKRYYNFLLNL